MRGFGIVICLLIALVSLVVLSEASHDCEEKGGEYVKKLNGLYTCIIVKEEK